jgi:AcrR family transcriptional regulator
MGTGNGPGERAQPSQRLTSIYEAAASTFVREGYAGATSRALANSAGVAESTLFRLVGDKQSLYRRLFDYAWTEINRVVAEAGFVADLDRPERTTQPAEILVGDLRAVAGLFEDARMRALVTFAFDALHRSPDWFDAGASHPYGRFRARMLSHAALHLRSHVAARPEDAEALANALVDRTRSAWMAWYHTPEHLADRRPTIDELMEQLRRHLAVDVSTPTVQATRLVQSRHGRAAS